MDHHTPQQQSLLKRSTSIWRRFSKRERPTISPPIPTTEPLKTFQPQKTPHKLQRSMTQKLQKRPTEIPIRKNIIHTHMQRVDVPKPRSETTVMSASKVRASDMQTSSFPNSSRINTVVWDVFLTPEQVFSLVMGFKPSQMEDKWFIYSEGPDNSGKLKVHFHRSWTGLKIAELFVLIDLKGLGAGKIVGIKWNGSEQTNGMSEEEAKYMISTTCAWVLKAEIEKNMF